MGRRIGYIDIAKAIAIACIIIGHTGFALSMSVDEGGMPSAVVRFAFSFHLPVFFLVSGYFFKIDQPFSLSFLKRDAKALLLPYAVTSILIIAFCATAAFFSETMSMRADALRWIKAALWGAGAESSVSLVSAQFIGGIWFLLAMFWARMLIVVCSKLPEWVRAIVIGGALVLSMISANYVWLPFSIQAGLGCAIYIYCGALLRKYDIIAYGRIRPALWVLLVAIWASYLALGGGRASVAMCYYPYNVIDIIAGIAAALCVVGLSQFIQQRTKKISAFMEWVGRNTLAIFCLHVLEDNFMPYVLPWSWWGTALASTLGTGAPAAWVIVVLIRFAFVGMLCGIVSKIPGLCSVYFPKKKDVIGREQKNTGTCS